MKKRYSILPVENHDLWKFYTAARDQYWTPDETDFSSDRFYELSDEEQRILKLIMAFFAVSDGIVNENIATSLIGHVEEPEAEFFYNFQMAMEDIHNETYGLAIETYIEDEDEKAKMFDPIEDMETVRKKAKWALKWLKEDSFIHRLAAFAAVEGLFFQGLFSIVYYFRNDDRLEGFILANDFISRDENSHYQFANHYYLNYTSGMPSEELRDMFIEAYETEKVFIEEVLETGLPGFTKSMGVQYIQFVTDTLLSEFGLEKEFNVPNPLPWMDRIAMSSKNNFFERRGGDYGRPTGNISFDEDF